MMSVICILLQFITSVKGLMFLHLPVCPSTGFRITWKVSKWFSRILVQLWTFQCWGWSYSKWPIDTHFGGFL